MECIISKAKETTHKHCTPADEVVFYGGISKQSDSAKHVH